MSESGTYVAGDDAYFSLPAVGPHAPELGAALITWVEPVPEHVVGYNRWYEDDHMITGAMVMPWMFSCRRWVAPRSHQHLRTPAVSRIAEPLSAGKYIGIYWINEGRLEDHERWALSSNIRLHAEGRGSYRGLGADPLEERWHVFTSFNDYVGPVYRDDVVPRDKHALMTPDKGMVVQVIDAVSADREIAADWLRSEYLPSVVQGPVALSTVFAPRPLPEGKLAHVREPDGVPNMLTVLSFTDVDPLECWEDVFASAETDIGEGGICELAVQAAFIPTVHGTDTYTDQLFD